MEDDGAVVMIDAYANANDTARLHWGCARGEEDINTARRLGARREEERATGSSNRWARCCPFASHLTSDHVQ